MAKKPTPRDRSRARSGTGARKTGKKKTSKKAARSAPSPNNVRIESLLEMIGPEFIEDGARRMTRGEIAEVALHADEIERKLRASPTFDRFRKDWPYLISLVQDHYTGTYLEGTYWTVSVAAFALRYVLKPIDIIPDSLPVVGVLDDALVLSHSLLLIRTELQRYRIWKLAREV